MSGGDMDVGISKHWHNEDRLVTTTVVKLGWFDRLRILLRGELRVTVETDTQYEMGRTRNHRTTVDVIPPISPRPPPSIQMEAK